MKVKSADSYFRLANDPAFAQEMSERQRSLSGSVRKSWPGTMLSAVTADVDPGKGRSANLYKKVVFDLPNYGSDHGVSESGIV